MNGLNTHRIAESGNNGFATCEDFRKVFIEDMESLYLLSFLLTGNQDEAEQCFLEGFDACVDGISVFRALADAWARRIIIRRALRMTASHAAFLRWVPGLVKSAGEGVASKTSLRRSAFTRVVVLEDFERSVFVLSILEGYSTETCALLLAVSQKEVLEARARALQHIADVELEPTAHVRASSLHA
jgi:DNA-directed RNA polymerase specialized sigma24 family protein